MSSIFISHSSKDNAIAKELERRLTREGHSSVFLDLDPEKGIVGGQSWERTLYRKIRACRAVIALVTDDYLSSHWCFAEVALARMEGKHLFALKVDPLSPDSRMPSIMTEKQYIDMRDGSEQAWERLWRGLEEVDVLGVEGEWDQHEAPYLGFSAFQEKHAPLYFGREDEARAGVELLERGSPGLIMTLGPSGSGKSSLVRAAIIPRLRRLDERWLIIEPMRPGRDPFAALAEALQLTFRRYAPDAPEAAESPERLLARLRPGDGEADSPEPPAESSSGETQATESEAILASDDRVRDLLSQLAGLRDAPPAGADEPFVNFLDWTLDDLREICAPPGQKPQAEIEPGETPLIDLANELRLLSGCPEARVLLVVDQFEELLGERASSAANAEFLTLLRRSVEAPDSPLMALATMRSDFLGLLQRNPVLRGMDYESLSLGPISTEGMRKVIEEPAKLGAIELEEGLTDRLIEDTETPDALPLLSFTLWVLWRDFTEDRVIQLSEYDDLGGLHGAVVREAEALVEPGDHAALRRAFLAMVRLNDEGNFARKQVPWDSPDLVPVHAQLEQFVQRRLLVVSSDGQERTVEVAHEALFRTWSLLRGWLDQGRSEMLLKEQISRDAKAWEQNQHDKDALWRGGRLLQARELMEQGRLDGLDKVFIATAVKRARFIRWSSLITAALLFLGLGALTMYAWDAKHRAAQGELVAREAQKQVSLAYEEVVGKFLLRGSGKPGPIQVDHDILEVSPALKQAGFGETAAILGTFGDGRVLAVAHDSYVAVAPGKNELFMEFALRWLTMGSDRKEVLYTVGHCETISESTDPNYRFAAATVRNLGFSANRIQDLSRLEEIEAEGLVLIIGNAWATFSENEIQAATDFVNNGGRILLVGLEWSWNDYRHLDDFDPCRFNHYSGSRSKETETYPMNTLGNQFGITFAPGVMNDQR